MPVLVATNDSPEGRAALREGDAEAQRRGESLVWVNLGSEPIDTSGLVSEAREVTPPAHQDHTDALLDTAAAESASVIVVGLRRRSPVGKLLLGSVAQRILLEANVPVIAVKADPAH